MDPGADDSDEGGVTELPDPDFDAQEPVMDFDPGLDDDYGSGTWPVMSDRSTSVVSAAFEDEVAFGRSYHGFRKGIYPLPNDEVEWHNEETIHAIFSELLGGQLFLSPIGNSPQKIIDIGTGTGIWAIEVADQFPSASVIGTDLSPIQPSWVPPNARMFIEDCEEPEWLHGTNFDLVHTRHMAMFLRDLDGLMARIHSNLRDGGWIELHELIPEICCDDGTMTEGDPLTGFMRVLQNSFLALGFKDIVLRNVEARLQQAGFINVQSVIKKVPISNWASDKYLRGLGMLMKFAISDHLAGMAAKPLAALNMTEEERSNLVQAVKRTMNDNSIHRYVRFCIFSAQKPGGGN